MSLVSKNKSARLVEPHILQALSTGGASFDELVEYLEKQPDVERGVSAISGTARAVLGTLKNAGKVEKVGAEWVLLAPVPHSNTNGLVRPSGYTTPADVGKKAIPPGFAARKGKSVSMEFVYNDVFRIEVERTLGKQEAHSGIWTPIPMYGNNVRLRSEPPTNDPDAEPIRDVTAIRLTYKNGDVQEFPHDRALPLYFGEML